MTSAQVGVFQDTRSSCCEGNEDVNEHRGVDRHGLLGIYVQLRGAMPASSIPISLPKLDVEEGMGCLAARFGTTYKDGSRGGRWVAYPR